MRFVYSPAVMRQNPRVLTLVACAVLLASGRVAPAAPAARSRGTERAAAGASIPTSLPEPEARVVGRITIPRLGISEVVRDGDGDDTLRIGVGHILGTPLPGDGGNVGLAAHRNTHFKPLRDIKENDRIMISGRRGDREYRVEAVAIVDPKDVWVLDPTDRPSLTLVTCYPFDWVGDAPQRLIVRAVAVEPEPVGPLPPSL
jgi:sortase A